MKKISLLVITFILSVSGTYSQEVLSPEDMNSVYKKDKHRNKITQTYAHLRQADVMWSRKIWREIDLRQKINHPFYYPMYSGDDKEIITDDRQSLIEVIYRAVLSGELEAYSKAAYDDEFRYEMTDTELQAVGSAELKTETIYDEKLLEQGVDLELAARDTTYRVPFDRNRVKKWKVKEEWFFDKQRSVMDVRILGLAPMYEDRDQSNKITGTYTPLFWIYFPEARNILINAEVYNLVKNDAERRTYDDIFWKRMFASTIVKESSVYDRRIDQFMVGLDALLEAERIKEELFNIEHDLWEY
tara:strand:+ start:14905 stop:15807 length:903 start_codon:yes stop_codon:yes gene_type:complete